MSTHTVFEEQQGAIGARGKKGENYYKIRKVLEGR